MKIIDMICEFFMALFRTTGKIFGTILMGIGLLLIAGVFGAEGVKILLQLIVIFVSIRLITGVVKRLGS